MAEERCSQRARSGRLGKARQFLLAAQLIKDFADEGEVADAYGSFSGAARTYALVNGQIDDGDM